MLKFFKLLRFNKRIGMLSKSLRYARQDLSSFGFVFLIFMIAYAIMSFTLFGRVFQSYKSFLTALTTCFRILFGEINAPAMIAASQLYSDRTDCLIEQTYRSFLFSRSSFWSPMHY